MGGQPFQSCSLDIHRVAAYCVGRIVCNLHHQTSVPGFRSTDGRYRHFGCIAHDCFPFPEKQSIGLERTFVQNLRSKEMRKAYLGESQPEYAGRLLDRDLHLSDFVIPADSLWGGKTLMELDFGKKYGVHVASIIRGAHRINIPGGGNRIFPNDKLQVIGTDEQLSAFSSQLERLQKDIRMRISRNMKCT